MPTGYCSEFNETDGSCIETTDIEGHIAAYQVKRQIHYNSVNHTEEILHDCYRLHNGDESETKWTFIDPEDPTTGVRLSYYSGDWCQAAGINREFHLEFYCDEIVENIPDRKEEIIFEDEICSYVLPIYTSYGCPTECPISSNNKLCDGHGVCEFDYTNNKPQCYCYYGWDGDDCSQQSTNQELYNITAPNDEDSCLFELEDSFGIKAHYNLSYFNVKGENWQVDDFNDREYIYKFQICGNLQLFDDDTEIPLQCRDDNVNHGPCSHWKESQYSYNNITTTNRYCDNTYDTITSNSIPKAVQLYYPKDNKSEIACYWLGMDVCDEFNMPSFSVGLLDKNDSGRGIKYTIENGEYCDEGDSNRELIIQLQCPDTRGYEFDPEQEAKSIINETILESTTCIYEIKLESPLACPFQCISPNTNGDKYAVCSSHGICASDPFANAIRCICDDGWTGIRCNIKGSDIKTTSAPSNDSSNNGVTIGLGVGITILVLIILGVFLYIRWKKKQEVKGFSQMDDGGLIGDNGVEAGQ